MLKRVNWCTLGWVRHGRLWRRLFYRQANDERCGPPGHVFHGDMAAMGLDNQTAKIQAKAPSVHALGFRVTLLELGEDVLPFFVRDGLTGVVNR